VIESRLVLERYPAAPVETAPEGERPYPFTYDPDDRADLGALTTPERLEDQDAVRNWVDAVLGQTVGGPTACSALLAELNRAVADGVAYAERHEEGVQTAAETLARGTGSCRDFAQLFIEAARTLGFGARFVTGYIYSPALDTGDGPAAVGAAATHAWAEAFHPDVGWIAYDPTNRAIESGDLIRVAATRSARQAAPISGAYTGSTGSTMTVEVAVVRVDASVS